MGREEEMKLICEQHGLELCGSVYMWIFFFSSKVGPLHPVVLHLRI